MATQRKNTVIPAIPKLKAHSTKEDIAGLAALLQNSFANGEEVTAEAITTVLELTGLIVKEKYEENADTNTFTDALLAKLTGVENGATADQTSAEIETAYNAEVAEASQVEAEAGTEVAVRRWSPLRVAQAIAALNTGLIAANNLSDLANVATAQANLNVVDAAAIGDTETNYVATFEAALI